MWHPPDYIVLLLVLILVTGFLMLPFIPQQMDPEQFGSVNDVLMAVIAIISLYVGARIVKNGDDK